MNFDMITPKKYTKEEVEEAIKLSEGCLEHKFECGCESKSAKVLAAAYRDAVEERDRLKNQNCQRCEGTAGLNNSVNTCHSCYVKESRRGDMWQGRSEKAESRLAELERLRDAIADEFGTIKNDISVMAAATKIKSRLDRAEEIIRSAKAIFEDSETLHYLNDGSKSVSINCEKLRSLKNAIAIRLDGEDKK